MKINELKEICIKNRIFYYFDDIIKIEDFDFANILLDEKSYENILMYNISSKTFIGAKPLRVRLDKVDEFSRVYDGTRYFLLFGPENHDAMYSKIRYLISQWYCICFSHNYASIKMIHMILCL